MWACASAGSGASGFDRERHVAAVVPVVSRGVGVGRLGETGGAFVGCVGGMVVTGGAFVGGFWAKLRCSVLSMVPAVSCGLGARWQWCLRFHAGVNACWQWCQWFQPGLGVGRLGETGGAFVGGFWAKLRCSVLSMVPAVSRGRVRALAVVPAVSRGRARAVSVVPAVSCGRMRVLAVVPVVSRGVRVGRLGDTGGAFVGCVGGLVVTGGAFVGGFWAQMRCSVLSMVPAVSCGRMRALAVVPVVSCGSGSALAVVSVVSCGRVRVLAVASPVSCGRVRALAVVPVVSMLSPWFFWVSII
mgnify:CR=1 FL=1